MRKSITYTVKSEGEVGRDDGKVFIITEMSASAMEWWAWRLALALGRTGAFAGLAEQIKSGGSIALEEIALDAMMLISPADAKPLLDELMECVEYVPDSNSMNIKRKIIENDIEELTTFFKLKIQVLNLHFDFFTNAAS